MPNRVVIVGDVHGMLAEVRALVAEIGLTKDDVLISAGDLVDKGPDSAGVVRHFRELREQGFNVVLVKGNHEEEHERFRKAFAANPEGASKFKNADELQRITEALSPEDVAFLNTAVMFHAVPEHNALVVHAGILPAMRSVPSQAEWAVMSRGEQEKFNRVLRVRHVTGKRRVTLTIVIDGLDHLDPEPEVDAPITLEELTAAAGSDLDAVVVKKVVRPKGSFVGLGDEQDGDPFWAEVYTDNRFGHVYFGHSPFLGSEPRRFPHATGLDTGAVFGGSLTAAVLEVGQEPKFVSVPASGKYATSLWEEA